MRAEKVAESKVLLLKVHRWMRKRQNSRPGNPFPFPPPPATCLGWGAALQSGACRLAAAYSPFPFCHFNIFNFFCTNMQCHIVSNSLSCSFPTNFLGHSCKSRHILSSEACLPEPQPVCLARTDFAVGSVGCSASASARLCLHFYLYFIFNWLAAATPTWGATWTELCSWSLCALQPFIRVIYFLTSWFHSICLPRFQWLLLPATATAT